MHMPTNGDLSYEHLERLGQFDTCTLSNAIERLNLRPRNEALYRDRLHADSPNWRR